MPISRLLHHKLASQQFSKEPTEPKENWETVGYIINIVQIITLDKYLIQKGCTRPRGAYEEDEWRVAEHFIFAIWGNKGVK
jgi:hypothetical protein